MNKKPTLAHLQLATLPPCAREIYSTLKEGSMNPIEIKKKVDYSSRSIRTGLKMLYTTNLIEKFHDFNDLRMFYYKIKA